MRASIAGIAVLVAGATGFLSEKWLGDDAKDRKIEHLEQRLDRLQLQMSFLRERKRLAEIEVLEQQEDWSVPGGRRTTFRFRELDPAGLPYRPEGQVFTIDGDVVYLDSQVIKFDDSFVEQNDLLKGSTLLLFRRIFGEFQAPADGFAIDSAGYRPAPYSAEDGLVPYHEDLWENFWDYANDPEVARESGVRAMHGEAPYIKLLPGNLYEVELRTSEGLIIRTREPLPAATSPPPSER